MLESVLVANRGEIAVRVLRTCRRLGIRTVAVHSTADADAPHVRLADEAVLIGPAPAAESYLDVERIVQAALASGAEAVHPGYGFLSENPALPEALAAAGITFVGPSADVIRLMGDKAAAKAELAAAGVPVVPGIDDPDLDDESLLARLDEVGYPLLLKAVAGGGGKGMRAVHDPADAPAALAAARREAAGAFGDDRMIVERLVSDPRHVEVQVVGDTHGTVLHVLERECSLQRRHQKVVEEAPAAHLDDDVRRELHAAAVRAAAAVGYVGAGTVEFLLDADGRSFHFLEMNTRLQVEHPVTELVTGLDLVELQLRVAAGQPLSLAQDDVRPEGHAVEVRLYAEDPATGFLPQTGTLVRFDVPAMDGTRLDSGVEDGSVVTPHYDPMLAKLVAHAPDRAEALRRLGALLDRTVAHGTRTNLAWLSALLADPEVRADAVHTRWLDDWGWSEPATPSALLAAAAVALEHAGGDTTATSAWERLGARRTGGSGWVCTLADRDVEHRVEVVRRDVGHDVRVSEDLAAGTATSHVVLPADGGGWLVLDDDVRDALSDGPTQVVGGTHVTTTLVDGVAWASGGGDTRVLAHVPATRHRDLDAAGGDAALVAPMPGSVAAVQVSEGEHVTRGQVLLVVEAMKMEHPVTAPTDGTATDLAVAAGDAVDGGQALVTVHPDQPDDGQDDGQDA